MIGRLIVAALAVLFSVGVLNYTIEQYGLTTEKNFLGVTSDSALVIISATIMLAGIVSGTAYRIVRGARRIKNIKC